MGRDKSRHKRYEFILDLALDAATIDVIAAHVRPGYSLANYMRDLIHARAPAAVEQAPAPLVMLELDPVVAAVDRLGDLLSRRLAPGVTNVTPRRVGEVKSQGINIERRRPARAAPAAVNSAPPSPLDPDALARELVRSVNCFGQGALTAPREKRNQHAT